MELLLEAKIEKKKEEIHSMQERLKKKKNELRELELKLEIAKAKEQAEFNARVVKEMEQRFGKFTEKSLEEFLENLDAGSSAAADPIPELYTGPADGL